ncbi:MAG: hypothetical protein ACJAYU_001893 [Bradymonadia bacterium]|jgi:hypothetical protein
MSKRYSKLVFISLSLAAASACSPSFENLPEDFILEGEGRTPEDAEANMAALRQLVSENREREPREAPANSLEVVVLGPAIEPALTGSGALSRSAVDDFVELGPHAVLGAVLLEPHYSSGAAVGFEISELYEGSEFIRGAGLDVGDVVTSVNGHSILMPDGFMDAWDSLSDAESLELEVIRDGVEETLTWPIEDTNSAPAASAP